jgi:hypothetical protein
MLKLHALAETAPTIDAVEARWAVRELTMLLRHIDPESPTAFVIQHARRELTSLIQSVELPEGGVAGEKVAA